MLPAYMVVVVCGVRGLGRVGRQHLAVALALEVPLLVAITKTDTSELAALAALTEELRCSSDPGPTTACAPGSCMPPLSPLHNVQYTAAARERNHMSSQLMK